MLTCMTFIFQLTLILTISIISIEAETLGKKKVSEFKKQIAELPNEGLKKIDVMRPIQY